MHLLPQSAAADLGPAAFCAPALATVRLSYLL